MKRALGDNKRSLVNTKCYAVDRVFLCLFLDLIIEKRLEVTLQAYQSELIG